MRIVFNRLKPSTGLKLLVFFALTCLVLGQSSPQLTSTVSSPAAQQASSSSNFQGEPISLKLVGASLVDFFRAVSELSGLNILIDSDVRGSITINVESVPWDQLFDVVLKSHRLDKSLEGNLVRISTKETLRIEEESVRALKRAAFLASDRETVSRRLNYADAKDVFDALQDKEILSERGELVVDERTNTLFVTDVTDHVQSFLSLLTTLDVPEPQVEIEARVIEATTNFTREIGSLFNLFGGKTSDRDQGGFTSSTPAEQPIGNGFFTSGGLLDTVRLDAAISLAERNGEARILSKPRVTAQNNTEAIITQGARIPIPVQFNFTTTVRFETAALRLTVTPQITDEKTIILNIKVENNIPDFSQTVLGIPTILTSEAQTQVLVQDGGTTMIGGIYVETERDAEDKVPGLGDVPILGRLFKRSSKERDTREILFFLTSKIKTE
ncbi:MAG: type IV pilus secretin PilQ [Acidobacteriota bacterium]